MAKKKMQEQDLVDEVRLDKVLRGINDAGGDNGGSDTITLSTGVVLKLKPVSKWLIQAVNRQFKRPTVPKQYVKSAGKDVENPMHPKYKDDMEKYLVDIGNATTDVCILRGTEIIEIPQNLFHYDSKECASEMKALGFKLTDNNSARYLYWVKYVAAPLDRDMNLLMGALGRLTGVAEADVLEAVARFRSSKKR